MAWTELRFTLERHALDAVSLVLFELGTAGIQEVDLVPRPETQIWEDAPSREEPGTVLVRAFFEDADRERIERALAPFAVAGAGSTSWHAVPDTRWDEAWKEGLEPLVISERLVIAPPWNAPPGAVIVEPGQGFGTGQHPSTRACLAALDAIARDASVTTALDVGCGSGILALAAARLGLSARGIDIEESAVREARANAARNRLEVVFDATPLARVEAGADLVLANLHAEVLVPVAPDLVRLTRAWLVIGGVLADREDRVRAAFEPPLRLAGRAVDGRWVSLRYRA
jgi:ribosomal protein L11 methyltransferase